MSHLTETDPDTLFQMRCRVREATDADRPTTLAMMRFIKDRDLRWPVSRVTRNRVHNVLQELGYHHEYETGFWYERPLIPEPTAFNLLTEAIGVIEGLAEQQAMTDNWFEEPLGRFKKALEEMRPGA